MPLPRVRLKFENQVLLGRRGGVERLGPGVAQDPMVPYAPLDKLAPPPPLFE